MEHVVFGRLDMTQPDLGIAGGRLLLDRMLADDRLPVEARGLICAEDCMVLGFIEPMYVYRRQGRVIASHQRGEAEQRHQPEITPEHHAWVDRAVRVAEAEGHRATEEKFTQDRKVRSDALIYGADGIRLGVESQVSPETPRKLKTRDNAARRNGVADAWQTPLHSLVELGVVPMLRTDALPAEIIKQPNRPIPFRSGVRHVDMVRCDERSPVPCPRRKAGGRCGRRHPRSRPKEHGFDQFIRDAAAGLLVRTTIRERRGLAFEFWTPLGDHLAHLAAAAENDDDITDLATPEQAADEALGRRLCLPMGEGDPTCRTRYPGADAVLRRGLPEAYGRPRPTASVPAVPRGRCGAGGGIGACGAPARLYPGGWLCDQHNPTSYHRQAR
ncbi:hypothetical protein ACGFNX_40620 [Streptomyces sp. NPDC048723]|uniref:hypothetical protein n=1 Tax=Streptomyces sp. NPDC048723 TaxID=3365589 RepID=UPI0037124B3D